MSNSKSTLSQKLRSSKSVTSTGWARMRKIFFAVILVALWLAVALDSKTLNHILERYKNTVPTPSDPCSHAISSINSSPAPTSAPCDDTSSTNSSKYRFAIFSFDSRPLSPEFKLRGSNTGPLACPKCNTNSFTAVSNFLYAKRWGYTFEYLQSGIPYGQYGKKPICLTHEGIPYAPAFCKVLGLYLMNEKYCKTNLTDFVVYMDSDALVYDHHINMYDGFFSCDSRPPATLSLYTNLPFDNWDICSAVQVFKCDNSASRTKGNELTMHEFITSWWKHVLSDPGAGGRQLHRPWEQRVLIHMMENNETIRSHVQKIKHKPQLHFMPQKWGNKKAIKQFWNLPQFMTHFPDKRMGESVVKRWMEVILNMSQDPYADIVEEIIQHNFTNFEAQQIHEEILAL